MWSEKRYNEQANWHNTSTQASRVNPQLTPRSKLKPNVPLPNSRRSITPSKIQERVSASPLRVPLERAIQRCTRERSQERPNSRSRMTNRSSRQADSSIMRRGIYEDEESIENNKRVHSETISFLKKYFDYDNQIPIDIFIDRLVQDYGDLWGNQNADQLMDHFSWKISQIFGDSVDPRDLIAMTKDNGIIGLILQVFQSINESEQPVSRQHTIAFSKSPNVQSINKSFQEQLNECVNIQHLKNIIQQFMQLMYQQMEKQIYSKFNAEMKRMVLKYREAERLDKKIREKLTMNADFFEAEAKWQKKLKVSEEANQQLSKKLEKKEEELRKQREAFAELRSFKHKLQEDNIKLRENLEKFQTILINKFENQPFSENSVTSIPSMPSISRKAPSNGPLGDRTQEFTNQNGSFIGEPKPFQIKIDTHFIQREMGPPTTHTTTTFMEQNFNGPPPSPCYPLAESYLSPASYSPIKINNNNLDGGRPSYDGGIRPGTKIGEYIYSPYQGKNGSRH